MNNDAGSTVDGTDIARGRAIPAGAGPLAGVRVVDLTVVWAGPYATMMLADLGADVVKVENVHVWQTSTRGTFAHPNPESLRRGSSFSASYPDDLPGERPWNQASGTINLLRNKRSVTMDLRVPEGRRPFEDLVRISDIVIENNVTETMDKLGVTYDYLRDLRPDIIYVRAPAFGSSGPYRNYRGFGAHLEGVSGHSLLRSYPDQDASTNTTIYAGDYFSGTHLAFAALAALHYRKRTGRGQLIEVPQVEAATGMLAQYVLDYALNQRLHPSIGNRDLHGAAPSGVYRARGEDRWLALTVCSDLEWRALAAVLGNPAWAAEARFATGEGRRDHHDELDRLLAEQVREHDVWELAHALQACGVAAGPVMDARDSLHDQHLRERGMFVHMDHPDAGARDWTASFTVTAQGRLPVHRPGVNLGEDNEAIYRDLLGYDETTYQGLIAGGHVGDRFDDTIP